MRQVTLNLPDKLFERLQSLAQAQKITPEELACQRLRRELGEDCIDSQSAKEVAKGFVHRRAGRCLRVRDPVLEEAGVLVWLVPVITNVRVEDAEYVGQVVIDARTGEVMTSEREVVAMFKRGHPSFGFRPFPPAKERRLSELLSRAQDGYLSEEERAELDRLVTEQQDLQLANLEELDRRLMRED